MSSTLRKESVAQLQHMGIDIYQEIEAINVAQLAWLPKVCELLHIQIEDCVFDEQSARYDAESKKLHLPASTYLQEIAFKKAVWQQIQTFVK
jgi:hypothetical protein